MNKCYHFDELDSTSSYLKRNFDKYDDLSIVSTDFQTLGHGRNNRKWVSDKGDNLLFSILIKNKNLINKFSLLSLYSAYVIIKFLEKENVKDVKLKWPNDVYVGDKKIAGVLLESSSSTNELEFIVIGVGLNVNVKEFDNDLIERATSLFLENEKVYDLQNIKKDVYEEFFSCFSLLEQNKISISELEKYNYLKDKNVYVTFNGERIFVKVIKINDDGSLKIKFKDKFIDICSGEVTFHI